MTISFQQEKRINKFQLLETDFNSNNKYKLYAVDNKITSMSFMNLKHETICIK